MRFLLQFCELDTYSRCRFWGELYFLFVVNLVRFYVHHYS